MKDARYCICAGNVDKQRVFERRAMLREEAIKEMMWSEEKGSWFDYHMDTQQQNTAFYPSNIFPLFANCYGSESSEADRTKTVEKVLQYIKVSITTHQCKINAEGKYCECNEILRV